MPGRAVRFFASLAVAGSLVAALPASASAVASPDTSCPPLGSANTVVAGVERLAQTFTATASGKLTAAEVRLTRNMSDQSGDYLLRLTDLSGGIPTNNLLGTATIRDGSVPPGSINLPVTGNFVSLPPMIAGKTYALIVTRPTAPNPQGLRVNTRSSVLGCAGSLFLSPNQTDPFVDQVIDLVFTTFVDREPITTILKHPKKKSKKDRARFTFVVNETGVRLECKLDRAGFKPCGMARQYKDLKRRKHHFEVHAVDGVDNVGPSSVFQWRVKKRKGR